MNLIVIRLKHNRECKVLHSGLGNTAQITILIFGANFENLNPRGYIQRGTYTHLFVIYYLYTLIGIILIEERVYTY